MFTKAIVKKPGKSITDGITSADLGIPCYTKAVQQHGQYVDALKTCGTDVIVLEADEGYPDSCFVEDTALLTSRCAIITYPGAESRRGEIAAIEEELYKFYPKVEHIIFPGTIEAGDIMMVGNTFYIGISQRTNLQGFQQITSILKEYGFRTIKVNLKEMLHLKTGLSYLEHNNLLIAGEFLDYKIFDGFNKIIVDPDESYAANAIWINDKVIVPEGFPKTIRLINEAGYETIPVDVSEFQKIDGGLSCLSLRF